VEAEGCGVTSAQNIYVPTIQSLDSYSWPQCEGCGTSVDPQTRHSILDCLIALASQLRDTTNRVEELERLNSECIESIERHLGL